MTRSSSRTGMATRRTGARLFAIAPVLLAAFAMLFAAAPASADHRSASCSAHRSAHYRTTTASCGLSYEDREFNRGFDKGWKKGFNRGYRAALKGQRFCDHLNKRFCGNSKWYKRGFKKAYKEAYRAGWEEGLRKRCARTRRYGTWRSGRSHY